MSLTSQIKTKKMKDVMDFHFPKNPVPNIKKDILVPSNTKQQARIGVVYDYFYRFYLEILDGGRNIIHSKEYIFQIVLRYMSAFITRKEDLNYYNRANEEFIKLREELLNSKSKPSNEQLSKALHLIGILSELDSVYRAGIQITERSPFIEQAKKEVIDMVNLCNPVFGRSYILLGPNFTQGYRVGGADVDIIADNYIIDLKTTGKPNFTKDMFRQVLGYWLLYQMGGSPFPNNPARTYKVKITHIGIYFARFGHVELINMEEYMKRNKVDLDLALKEFDAILAPRREV